MVEPTEPAESKESQPPVSNGAQDELQKRIEELEAQVKDKESRYLYLYAEFENYKKRAIKERSDLLKYGWEGPARELLQIMDNFDRALSHIPQGTDKNFVQGLQMVADHFKGTLDKQGIKPMESLGQPFDPNFHEAVGQEPSDKPAGTITQELGRGYTLHGRLLRPARVVISTGTAPQNLT